MNLDHFFIYFAVAVVLNICLIPFFMRLVESRPGVETLYNPSWVSRPFRFIAALPYLITSSTLHDNRHDKGKN